MCETLKNEFNLKKIWFDHEDESDFYISQWQKDSNASIVYLSYRCLIAATFLVTWLLAIIDIYHIDKPKEHRLKWMIYLTHWGYTVCTIYAVISYSIVLYVKIRKPESGINMCICCVCWVFFTIAIDFALLITSVYWTLIFLQENHIFNIMNLFVHGMNSVLMLIDLFIVRHPVRLLHFYWPLLFGTIYIVFNVVYYFADGTTEKGLRYVYNFLDWTKPGKCIAAISGVLLLLLIIHFCTFCLYSLRKLIHDYCKSQKVDKSSDIKNKL